MKQSHNYIKLLIAVILLSLISACDVHEFPNGNEEPVIERVTKINIHHEQGWDNKDYVYSRAEAQLKVRYVLRSYERGATNSPIYECVFYSSDLTRSDFAIDLPLPEGSQDLYIFADYVEAEDGDNLHYDVSDFSYVSNLRDQYVANTDSRDAFACSSQIEIHYDYESGVKEVNLSLTRPMARYVVIANDLDKLGERLGVAAGSKAMGEYEVIVKYPLYMPSAYNMFSEAPADSWTGMSYEAPLERISPSEAKIGMDYMWVNHHEGSLQMQLFLRNPQGETVPITNVFTVPMARGRTTWIRGPFLTSTSSGSIGINPDFDGDYFIEIN